MTRKCVCPQVTRVSCYLTVVTLQYLIPILIILFSTLAFKALGKTDGSPRYSTDVHRTKCKALTITRLTHSPYTTKIARIRCYTMLSTIFNCKDL